MRFLYAVTGLLGVSFGFFSFLLLLETKTSDITTARGIAAHFLGLFLIVAAVYLGVIFLIASVKGEEWLK